MGSARRRLTRALGTIVTVASCLAAFLTVVSPLAAEAATLGSARWTASPSTTGSAGAAYTYGFTIATRSPVTSVTMTVPSGTAAGTLTVGTVTPGYLKNGTVALSGTTLTYTLSKASQAIAVGTAASIQIIGLTNTTTTGSYTSTITTIDAGTTVDTGTTPAVAFTPSALSNPAWAASTTTLGATSASYTYTFTTTTTGIATTSVRMSVPPGTGGTPTIGAVSPSSLTLLASVSLSGTTLTYSFTSVILASGTNVSIKINGLTNTTTAGTYSSEIVTRNLGVAGSSGTTPSIAFNGTLTMTGPASLSWADTLNGRNQAVVDNLAGDQQLAVADTTATGNGWHLSASATTLTSGTHTLPDTGTILFTGSVSSPTATTSPAAACVGSCTLPAAGTATYPVALTTAPSSPTSFTIYDCGASYGLGTITVGGSSSSNPAGWWVEIPGDAHAGTYTTTVTLAVVSGP